MVCENLNECSSHLFNSCDVGQRCLDSHGTYSCTCDRGYVVDPENPDGCICDGPDHLGDRCVRMPEFTTCELTEAVIFCHPKRISAHFPKEWLSIAIWFKTRTVKSKSNLILKNRISILYNVSKSLKSVLLKTQLSRICSSRQLIASLQLLIIRQTASRSSTTTTTLSRLSLTTISQAAAWLTKTIALIWSFRMPFTGNFKPLIDSA